MSSSKPSSMRGQMGYVKDLLSAYDLDIRKTYNANGTIKHIKYYSDSTSQFYFLREVYTYSSGKITRIKRSYHERSDARRTN